MMFSDQINQFSLHMWILFCSTNNNIPIEFNSGIFFPSFLVRLILFFFILFLDFIQLMMSPFCFLFSILIFSIFCLNDFLNNNNIVIIWLFRLYISIIPDQKKITNFFCFKKKIITIPTSSWQDISFVCLFVQKYFFQIKNNNNNMAMRKWIQFL